ncbi:unnamed protein product [Rotaria sp. Silwood2]|nr:unnamed protein product [Rotaria sp. Silwood2]CAF4189797.1 unnamed protein product [Rotaria sp. Silwood2]
MFYNKVVFILLLVSWLCSTGNSVVLTPKRPIQSHITGGYKKSLTKNDASKLDCSEFSSDYDVLQQFPFPILVNPIQELYNQSTATMDENDVSVKKIYFYAEEVVPSSVFCLSKLQTLDIRMTPFHNGIVPNNLANLKLLRHLWIYDTSILKISEQLGTLNNLVMIVLSNCSLTHLPNLSKLQQLTILDIPENRLSEVDGMPGVLMMDLRDNFFKEIPTTNKKERITYIIMGNNPLKSIESITSYTNLEGLYLRNTTLKFIPPTIGKLKKLKYLELSDNQLSQFPKNILNLPHLETLDIKNNLLSSEEIQSIQKEFAISHPNAELIV